MDLPPPLGKDFLLEALYSNEAYSMNWTKYYEPKSKGLDTKQVSLVIFKVTKLQGSQLYTRDLRNILSKIDGERNQYNFLFNLEATHSLP